VREDRGQSGCIIIFFFFLSFNGSDNGSRGIKPHVGKVSVFKPQVGNL
jgi:hypothetical protein